MARNVCFGLAFFALSFVFLSLAPAQASLVGTANQATLSLSPESGTFNPNANFALNINLNTQSQNVVAVAAYITYDKANFQAVSIDTSGSAFTMEAENAIDSANGQVRIALGKPTPGVNSANAFVAKINFKALSATNPASDNFAFSFAAGDSTKSTAIKDDGLGTNVLSGVYNGRYSVSTGSVPGDINGDGRVDIFDLSRVGSAFGAKPSGSGWDPAADVVPSGEIDIYDLVFVGSRFT